jgi:hypothetical protein
MKLFNLILFFFVSLLLSKNAMAIDTQKLEAELDQVIKINKKECTKSMVLKSYMASVKINHENVEITTKNVGNTYVYLWSKSNLEVYNLYVLPKKETKKNPQYNPILLGLNNDKVASGKYNINVAESFSDKTNFSLDANKNLNHSLSYNIPLFENNLNIETNFKSNFTNFTELSELSIQSLSLGYSSKNFNLDLGNIATINSIDKTIMRGLNFTYNPSALNNFRVYAGFNTPNQVELYQKTKNLEINDFQRIFTSGITGTIHPFEWMRINSGFSGTMFLKDNSKTFFSNIDYKINPSPNFILSGMTKSDFKSINTSNNLYLRQELFNKDNYIDSNISYSYQNDSVSEKNSNKNQSYSVTSGLKLQSNTQVFSKYSKSLSESNAKISMENFSLKVNQEVQKGLVNVYSQYDMKKINDLNSNTYQIGSNISLKKIIPIDLAYSHTGILDKETLNVENLDVSWKLAELENFSLVLNNSTYFTFNPTLPNKNTFSNNLTFSSGFNPYQDLSLRVSAGYRKEIEDKTYDKLFLKLDSTLRINPFQELKVQIAANNTINGPTNITSNASYNFAFGGQSAVSKGKIVGSIFEDTNNNGFFDKEEKTFPDIKIAMKDKVAITDKNGKYEFNDIEYGDYEIKADKLTLPKGYKLVADQESVSLSEKTKEVNFITSNKINVKGVVYSTPKKNKGVANIQINVDSVDNLNTDEDGYFSVKVIPGLHVFQVDYNSIPKNYTMKSKITQNIEVSEESETNVEFILNPIRIIKGLVHKKDNKESTLEGIKITVKHLSNDNEVIKTEEIESDEDGEFSIEEFEGDSIEITTKENQEPIKVQTPDTPFKLEYDIQI